MNAAGASPPGTRLGTSLASWVEHPGRVLVGCLVLFLALAPGLARLSLDNSPERFFVRDADALARYERFEFDFGRDRSVRLVFEGPGIWTREGLAWIAGIEESAAHVRGVLATAGPVAHHRWRLGDDLSADPAGFRAEVLADPLDHEAGWVSDDGTTVTVLVALYKLSSRDQEQVLEALEERVASPPPGIRAWVTGLPAVQRALDRALLEMAEIFFPILALLALLLLAAVFGGLRGAFRPLVLVLFCQGCVFGAMGWAGVAVDMVTVVLVPLLFVVTLATAIHLEVRFRAERRRAASAPAAARATLDAKLWAVVCTGGTTAVGFGSLVVAQLPSVRALGLWSLGGFLFMTAAAVTLYPALLARTREAPSSARQTAFDRLFSRWGGTWAAGAVAHRGRTLGLFALAGLVAAAGLPRLYLESSFLDYFHHDHPVRRGLDELTARGLGVISAELVLTLPDASMGAGAEGSGFRSGSRLDALARLAADLRGEPELLGVVGAGDLVADVASYLPPSSTAAAALETIAAQPALDRMLGFFVTPDGRRARLTLLVPMAGYARLAPALERARIAAAEAFPDAQVEVTGRYPLILASRRTLLRTMFGSLALTLLAVALVLRWLLRSTALALRALVPNLWPVLMVLGAMAWLRVGIDATTVMIASAALGLAVDDTFHTLGAFRRHLEAGPPEAARASLSELAGAHTITSLVLAAGFAACAASSFLPIARFGALTALAVVAALAADLWMVPALLAGASAREVARLRQGKG